MLYPVDFRASSYVGLALLNTSSLQERSQIRRLIDCGRCLMMEGGWLDLAWT